MLRAVQTLGSEKALADALGVMPEKVAKWLRGEEVPHNGAYLAALDIVATGRAKPQTFPKS